MDDLRATKRRSFAFRNRATILRNIAFAFGSTLSSTVLVVAIALLLHYTGLREAFVIPTAFILTLPWLIFANYRFYRYEMQRARDELL